MRTRPLTELSGRDLQPLLQEESEHWGEQLRWDFADVTSAVQSGMDRRALTGFVVEDGVRAVAYCYYMLDAGRAIVGSVFAAAGFRGRGLEEQLVDAVLDRAQRHPGNARVECQTLFSTGATTDQRFERAGFASRSRHYLLRELRAAPPVPEHAWSLRPVRREDVAEAARIIHRSHAGSLDAALNLTYATPSHCRGFVETLMFRAGCGRFDPQASLVAEGPDGLAGVLLASQLSRSNGHICQVSVLPEMQGRGLGRVLLTAALSAFRRQGLASASLSVTVANQPAYCLYQRLGFDVRKEFAAHAWVRPPQKLELPA